MSKSNYRRSPLDIEYYLKIPGVYVLINRLTNKRYIGSTSNLYRRTIKHRSSLRKGVHYNIQLQEDWNKYGEDNFKFKIIELCKEYKEQEQFYLDNNKDLYNKYERAFSPLGSKHTKRSKEKISKANKGLTPVNKVPIDQYDLNMNFIQSFDSITEASKKLNIHRTSIHRAILAKRKIKKFILLIKIT